MDTNVISESQYKFDEKALQLAQNFFDITDISLLKVGMFGYITALNSNMMRDSTFHRDVLFNEFFIPSANLNSTLYKWSKIVDYPISVATPSRMDVAFKVVLNDLQQLAVATDNSAINKFIIPRETTFDVGGFTFMLPYELQVLFFTTASGQLSISASYNISNDNYKDPSITSPYLKVMLSTENGLTYVTIGFTIYQVTKKDYVYTMASNDILDSNILEQNYGSNFVTFKASYAINTNNISAYVPIETIFNEIDKPVTDVYGYYTFIGDDTLRMYFSSAPGDFRPAFNSKIKLEIYTTDAESGNFTYSGNITLKDSRFSKTGYSITPLSSGATGGASISSFTDTKIALMEQLRTRNNYVTTYDLETYFKNYKRTNLSTNADFQVVKIRDDIFRRQFSLYILQKNADSEIIPTNTVDLLLSLDEIADLNYSIKPGTMIVYDRIEGRYRLLANNELPEAYLNSVDSYLFCIPFLINFDFKEFPKANYYSTHYSTDIALTYSAYNINAPFEVVINSFNINRNPIYDIDHFNLNCYLNTSTLNLNNVKLRIILSNEFGDVGYADLSREASTSKFSLNIMTNDRFDEDGFYLVEDTFKDITSGTIIPEIKLDGSYQLRFAVLVNDPNVSTTKTGIYAQMVDIDSYGLICELVSNESVPFADNLSDIMYSQVIIDTTTSKLKLNKVPVIGSLFYLNDIYNTYIMNDIRTNIYMARKVTTQLENNTSVDIKFFNTSGLSKYYDIDTTDMRLKISIALTDTPTKAVSQDITSFIVQFIEATNTKTEKRFSISNLLRALENNYSNIRYIKFFTINGSNIQNIEQQLYKDTHIDALPITYVPEYISVRKKLPLDASLTNFDYDIEIEYI